MNHHAIARIQWLRTDHSGFMVTNSGFLELVAHHVLLHACSSIGCCVCILYHTARFNQTLIPAHLLLPFSVIGTTWIASYHFPIDDNTCLLYGEIDSYLHSSNHLLICNQDRDNNTKTKHNLNVQVATIYNKTFTDLSGSHRGQNLERRKLPSEVLYGLSVLESRTVKP